MALVVGTNSWATRVEADAYLTDRVNATNWFTLNDTPANPGEQSKDSYLISAFFWIQGSPEVEISAGSTDDDVKNAQIEAAFFLLEHYNELNERRAAIATGVQGFRYSKRAETFDPAQLKLPANVLGLLTNYGTMNVTVELAGEYDV